MYVIGSALNFFRHPPQQNSYSFPKYVNFTDAPSWSTGSPDTGQSFAESETVPCEFPVFVVQSVPFVVVHSDFVFSSQQLFSCAFTIVVAANINAANNTKDKILIFILMVFLSFIVMFNILN